MAAAWAEFYYSICWCECILCSFLKCLIGLLLLQRQASSGIDKFKSAFSHFKVLNELILHFNLLTNRVLQQITLIEEFVSELLR